MQFALAHACTINARWVASTPSYDPILNSEIQHNITDPLIFEKQTRDPATANAHEIGPTIGIDSSWASLLNIPLKMEETIIQANSSNATQISITAGTFQWLTNQFLYYVTGTNQSSAVVQFVPAYTGGLDDDGSDNSNAKATSETLATILSLLVNDGLARVYSENKPGVELQSTGGNLTWLSLLAFEDADYFQYEYNNSADAFAEHYPYTVLIDIDRYGYGYGM